MTNIAKREAKTSTQKKVSKALNKAVAKATKKTTKTVKKSNETLTAWATVRDDQITGLFPSRTRARNAKEEKRIFGEDLGTVRKATVSLV